MASANGPSNESKKREMHPEAWPNIDFDAMRAEAMGETPDAGEPEKRPPPDEEE